MNIKVRNVIGSGFIGMISLFLGSALTAVPQPLLHSVHLQIALLGSSAATTLTPYSALVNPAFIAGASAFRWALGGEQRFLAPGWTEMNTGLTVPVKNGGWGVFVGQEGLPFSYDQRAMVTHGRNLVKDFSLGVSLGVNRKKVSQFNAVLTPVAAAGVVFPFTSALKVSVSFTHCPGLPPSESQRVENSVFRGIISYEPDPKVSLVAGVNKRTGWSSSGFFSLQYRPQTRYIFRSGFSGAPVTFWFGFCLGLGTRWFMEVHSGYHPLTGVSKGMNLLYASVDKINQAHHEK